MTEQVVVIDPRLPSDAMMLADITDEEFEKKKGPFFNVSEVAEIFFGMTSHWLRLAERNGKLILDGLPVGDTRTEKTYRIYNLRDIELVAHALAENESITAGQLMKALVVVRAVADVYGYIKEA